MRTIVAIPSDEHCGSVIGLMPPNQWQLDAGGFYDPSPGQKEVIWKQWVEGWERVRELRGRNYKARLIVAQNNDCVEGTHDHVMGVFARRRETQERIFTKCMDWGLKKAGFGKCKEDQLYVMRGTIWHVGRGAESSERIAEDLGAIPEFPGTAANDYEDARHSWYHLRLKVEKHLLDIAHHGPGPGSRAWTKENSLYHTIKSVYFNSLEEGLEIPRAWIRSHYHQWIDPPSYTGNHGKITGFLTPSFQLITPFGIKVSKGLKLASIGMLILIVDDELTWECPHVKFQHAPVVEV